MGWFFENLKIYIDFLLGHPLYNVSHTFGPGADHRVMAASMPPHTFSVGRPMAPHTFLTGGHGGDWPGQWPAEKPRVMFA
jgi:hypothetical protein